MTPTIRKLTIDDLSAAVGLCRQVGWNQIETDWRRLVEYEPQGCFCATIGRTLAGTVTTTRYGRDVAWIGMMLVTEEHRRKGVATSLMKCAIDYLQSHHVQCIRLDATPAGKAVYQEFGFESERTFSRWSRNVPQSKQARMTETTDVLDQSLFAIDRDAFGADRRDWLERLAGPSQVITTDHGFGMLRPGYLADYLGPIVAKNPEEAVRIAGELLDQSAAKQVFWDVYEPIVEGEARSLGFRPVRQLIRMWLGKRPSIGSSGKQYAIGDPGTG